MVTHINVLTESFQMLLDNPELFAPKLFSTTISTIWFIGLFSGAGPLYLYIAVFPFLAVLGVFVSLAVAAMVRDGSSILEGSLEAAGQWRNVMLTVLLLFLVSLAVYVPAVVGAAYYFVFGVETVFFAGVAASILMLFVAVFLSYFYPIGLLEKESVLEGFRASSRTSVANSSEVVSLTLLSFALLAATSIVDDSGMKLFGYAGFAALRMVSSVVTTYFFVVSPNYYLEASS